MMGIGVAWDHIIAQYYAMCGCRKQPALRTRGVTGGSVWRTLKTITHHHARQMQKKKNPKTHSNLVICGDGEDEFQAERTGAPRKELRARMMDIQFVQVVRDLG